MKISPEIKERIIAAANALVAEGTEEPTNAAVLERIGKGSLAHVSPVMREWRESRKAEVVAALEMPGDLKRAVETSLGQVWSTASKLAQAAVQSYRQKADETIEAANQERDEALSEIQRLEAKVSEFEKTLADKDQAINKVISDLEGERARHAKANTENAALRARIEDRDAQLKELKDELAESRKDNKTLQGQLVEIARTANESKPL